MKGHQKPHPAEIVPVSKMDLSLAKAEAIRDAGGVFVIASLRVKKSKKKEGVKSAAQHLEERIENI